MKKALSVLCVFALLILLCSCGKPQKTSDTMYQIGINALQTADDYIAGKLTGEKAAKELKEYKNQAETQEEKDCEELGTDTLIGTNLSNNSSIALDIYFLYNEVDGVQNGTSAMSEVREKRDDLAEQLGKKRNAAKKTVSSQKSENKYSYDELKEIKNYISSEMSNYGFKYDIYVNEKDEKITVDIYLKLSYSGAEETFADTAEWAVPIVKQAQEKYKFDFSSLCISFMLYSGSLKGDSDSVITYKTEDLSTGLLIDTKTKIAKSYLSYKDIRKSLSE